jgi:acetyl esterase/lipase
VRAPFLTIVLAFVGLLALSACSRLEILNDSAPDSGYSLSQNIVYDDVGNRLDVYAPQNSANAPVVVFFYGGRWEMGKKDDYKFVGQALASHGFVAVLPDYRKYPQVRYPDFLIDCAHAVQWVHKNIGGYGGSPNRIVLMGHDAGAYNAAMLTLDPEFLAKVGGNRGWVRGFIGLAGAYDFLPMTDPDLRDLFGPPEGYDKTQPVLYVDGSNPPLLLMHGGKDETIPISNTNSLYDRVRRAGGPVDKVVYPDLDHQWLIYDVSARLQGQADVLSRIDAFVRQNTAGNPPQPNAAPSGIQTYVPPK